jgi:hypothetical protein
MDAERKNHKAGQVKLDEERKKRDGKLKKEKAAQRAIAKKAAADAKNAAADAKKGSRCRGKEEGSKETRRGC